MVQQSRAKSLADRILLWFFRNSERQDILGVPVVVPADQRNGDAAFAKITAAFDLLRDHGSRSLDDLRRHTNGVFVWATAGALGEWHRDRGWWFSKRHTLTIKARPHEISLQPSFTKQARAVGCEGVHVFAGAASANQKVCFRRQLAFARRLSEGGDLVGQAERQLQRPPGDFTHQAWRQRAVSKLISLGVARWLAHAISGSARLPRRLAAAMKGTGTLRCNKRPGRFQNVSRTWGDFGRQQRIPVKRGRIVNR